jgi:heme/copper-type cytochrome/quinol oxidase subunit 3
MSDLDDVPGGQLVVDSYAHERKAITGSYWTASRLFVAVSVMLFGAGAFSYFYLHSLNNNGLWRAPGQRPSGFISVPVLVMTVAGSLLYVLISRRAQRPGANGNDWRVAAAISTLLLFIAALIQFWGMRRLNFFPGSSGFASVYVAVMPLFGIWLLIGAYWVEVLLARSMRVRWVLAPVGENVDSHEAVAFSGSLDGSRLFVGFLGLLSVVLYVLFSVLK